MNQERKAKIVAAVKPILKKYGMKGTFKVDHYSSITLTLKSGKIDFIADLRPEQISFGSRIAVDKEKERKQYSFDINQYWFHEHYIPSSKACKFLNELIPAMKAADWYDNSDARIDYFDTAYYYHIKVGRWDKPYEVE